MILNAEMDYCILKGVIAVFLIQHCTSEDVPSSIQSSSALNLQDESEALTQEQEPALVEVVPVVAPPSLQEVQQAVQEASEQVEGRRAEEVLKGLLERVVEAALGQVEEAGEAKMDDTAAVIVEEAGTENADNSQNGELADGEVVVGEDVKQKVVDTLDNGAVPVEKKREIAAVNERKPSQEVVEPLENTENINQKLTDHKETATDIVVGGEPVQGTVLESDLVPGLDHVEQDRVAERTGDSAQTVEGEALEQAIDTNLLQDNEMLQVEDIEGNLVVQEADSKHVEGEEAKAHGDGETVIEVGSMVPKVADGSEAGEEEQTTLETANSSKAENQEVLQNTDGEAHEGAGGGEAPVGQSPEQHPENPPPSPSLSGVEMGRNTPEDEKLNHGNEIISPTDDQAQAYPTLDDVVKEVLVLPPQVEGEQLDEANELVEDPTNNGETSDAGFEAWKIGAICAAVLLVLETVVIIVYILRNRNKNSGSGQQRECEEGCVEPEATTGGEYNDDTLPTGNGDTQHTAILDPSNVASTLLQNKEQEEVEQVIPMSELQPSSVEDTPNNTAEPEPSQDRRTSAL